MSGGSIIQTATSVLGAMVGGPIGAIAGSKAGSTANMMLHPPKPPTLLAPNALSSTPTQADASKPAAEQNLEQEKAAASTSTILTGGQGLLDSPSTTSRALLGG